LKLSQTVVKMSRYPTSLLVLLASLVALAQARPTTTSGSSSSSSTGSSIARGALIAIIVCVVVGVILCLICTFCLIRIMRRRKAAKVGGAVPMATHEKPVDNYGYTGGAASNNGYPAPGAPAQTHQEYNGQAPAYGGQHEYTNHQNEYNAGYNGGQQQSYAPPPGPPAGMPMPNAHY